MLRPSNLEPQPSTVKEGMSWQMLPPHASFKVPEWSSKYIRYEHLAKIISPADTVDKAEKKQRELDAQTKLELADAAVSQHRNRSPPAPGSPADLSQDELMAGTRPPSKLRRHSVSQAAASSASSDALGRVTIEIQSDFSSQKE